LAGLFMKEVLQMDCMAPCSRGLFIMKILNQENYKPIKNFGYFFIVFGILGFFVLFAGLYEAKYALIIWAFIGLISAYHLALGVGIILQNQSIFRQFKIYLKLMAVGYPIGTYISRKTLDYIEKHNIENYLSK
jgi:hypothetical protein